MCYKLVIYITKGVLENVRKDVLVIRPEGTKIYIQRDCKYVYYVTGSEYKKDKQYVVEKRVCIGKMVDDENMIPNDNFYQYFEIEGGNEEEPLRFSDALQVGAPALISKIMDDLKISELLESIHGKEDADLIKDLISYVIVRGTSTMQHYADFAWGHLVKAEKQWNDCKISEFLKMKLNMHRQNCLYRSGMKYSQSTLIFMSVMTAQT